MNEHRMAMTDWELPTFVTTILNRARRSRGPGLRVVRPHTTDQQPPHRPPRWPWTAVAIDVLLVTAAPGLASSLERVPTVRAMATLGGHPGLMQVFALLSLATLVTLAALTEGYRKLDGGRRSLLSLAGMCTVVAGTGAVVVVLAGPVLLPLIVLRSVG